MSTEKVNHRAIKLAKLYAKDDWRKGGQKFRTSLINAFIPLAELSLKWTEEEIEQRSKLIMKETLSAKDFLELYLQDHPFPADPAMIQAAEAYAAQEVALQIKRLREEREQIHSYLTRLVEVFEHGLAVYPLSCLHRDGKQLLDQSNQQNERKDTICD